MKQLYDELHLIKKELTDKIEEQGNNQDIITYYMAAELMDVKTAIKKLDDGSFGQCEFSGEPLPFEWMVTIPTLKTKEDVTLIQSFFKKTFNDPSL